MIKGKGIKLGDTLVEVTLAIGIFSMVAIAAVSVISASTSGTQSILENTLTREQIDSQAEALRFIQSAYAAEGERDPSNPTKYALLWQAISSHAISLEGTDAVSSDVKNNILNYNPTTCSALYTDTTASIVSQNAFIINLNALGSDVDKNNVGNIVVPAEDNTALNGAFRPATTYPRLIYGAADNLDDPLYNPNVASNLYAAEGLFVVAVKDTSGTTIVSDDTGNIGSISAYIDFYIRSCWFATGSERPTTISTVIRLYNPDTVSINKYERKGVIIKYAKGADDATGTMPSQYILSGTSASPLANRYERPGYKFMGWALKDASGNTITEYLLQDDDSYNIPYIVPVGLSENQTVTLTAIWKRIYTITYYDTNGKDVLLPTQSVLSSSSTHPFDIDGSLNPTEPTVHQTGNTMYFLGWSENKNGSGTLYNVDGSNNAQKVVVASAPDHQDIKLYPVWREIITFTNVPWNNFGTYSYCTITKSDSGITLQGNRRQAVDCGVEFAVDKNDTFELSADLNTSGIYTHPTGLVAVSVGPLVAIITTGGSGLIIYYGYLPLTSSVTSADINSATNYTRLDQKSIPNGGTVTIKLTKYVGTYTMSVNGYEVKIETRENNNGTYSVLRSNGSTLASGLDVNQLDNLKVKYTMIHTSHNCSARFNATLYNIRMTKSDIYYDTN